LRTQEVTDAKKMAGLPDEPHSEKAPLSCPGGAKKKLHGSIAKCL